MTKEEISALAQEIAEFVGKHGAEDTPTYLLVSAHKALTAVAQQAQEPVRWMVGSSTDALSDRATWSKRPTPAEIEAIEETARCNVVVTPLYAAPVVQPVAERDQLRQAQCDFVMPLLGPLLDAWECCSSAVRSEHPELDKQLRIVNRAMEDAEPAAQPVDDIEDPITLPRGLIGAACSAIDKKRDAPNLLEQLRRYTVGDLSRPAAQPVADAPEAQADDDEDLLAVQNAVRLLEMIAAKAAYSVNCDLGDPHRAATINDAAKYAKAALPRLTAALNRMGRADFRAKHTAAQPARKGLTEAEIDALVAAHAPPIHPDFRADDDHHELVRAVESNRQAAWGVKLEGETK